MKNKITDAAKIQEIGDAFERETENIFENDDLSSAGKSKRYADLARKTTATTNAWRDSRLAEIDKHIARVQRDVDAAANPRDVVPTDPTRALLQQLISEVRASEIRQSILTMLGSEFDPQSLLLAYLGGDSETRSAMERAPAFVSRNATGGVTVRAWIPQKEVDRQRLDAAAATHPEAVDALELLQASRMSVDRFAKMLLLEIAAMTPVGQHEPTVVMDDGTSVTVTPRSEPSRVGR